MSDNHINSLSMRTLNKIIKRIKVTSDSIILIRGGSAIATQESIDQMETLFRISGLKNIVVVVVDSLDDVRVLDKHAMRRKGWFYFGPKG